MKTVIVDIDGTVSDSRHRVHHVTHKPKNPAAFHALCHLDPVIRSVAMLVRALCYEGHQIVLVTGRPDTYRETTQDWFDAANIPYDELHMKVEGDTRSNAEYKSEVLQKLRDKGHDVFLAIDDMTSVVDMWRSEGIHCLHTQAI